MATGCVPCCARSSSPRCTARAQASAIAPTSPPPSPELKPSPPTLTLTLTLTSHPHPHPKPKPIPDQERSAAYRPWRALGLVSAAAAAAAQEQPRVSAIACTLEADLEAIGPVDAFECRAPCFAVTDERQRRVFNPVTATTLVGKCAALLPRRSCAAVRCSTWARASAPCATGRCARGPRARSRWRCSPTSARAAERCSRAPRTRGAARGGGGRQRFAVVRAACAST